MDFGYTLRPEHTVDRTVALARQAEAAGFDYGWLDDAQGARDVYPLLTLMAEATERMRLGTCVTNPATRDITVSPVLVNHVRERPSRTLRRVVDERDPHHRPGFVLTPSLRVRVYRGRDLGTFEIANLRKPLPGGLIARSD